MTPRVTLVLRAPEPEPRLDGRSGRIKPGSVPQPTLEELRELNAAERGLWYLGAAVLEQTETVSGLLRQLIVQSGPTLSQTPPPAAPAAAVPSPAAPAAPRASAPAPRTPAGAAAGGSQQPSAELQAHLNVAALCTLQRWAKTVDTKILRRAGMRQTTITLSEQVPIGVAQYLVEPFTTPTDRAKCVVSAPLSDAQIAALLVRGGGARARHDYLDGHIKTTVRVMGMWDGKLYYQQRTKDTLVTSPVVTLKLRFNLNLWEPFADAQVFPEDGKWSTDARQVMLDNILSVPLASLPTTGFDLDEFLAERAAAAAREAEAGSSGTA
jgi:hypothetical protein